MATKLRNLRVKKVDFVDEGANPRADIKLFKRKEGESTAESIPATESLFKRFVKFLKGEGLTEEEIMKEATSFNDQVGAANLEKIRDEIWSACYALQCSMDSILRDEELDSAGKQSVMEESTGQFYEAVKGYIPNWSSGVTANIQKKFEADETDLPMLVSAHGHLEELLKKSKSKQEGELEDMLKIDKSKMSAEERAAYEELIAKYAVETEEPESVDKTKTGREKEEEEIEEDGTEKGCKTKKSASAPPVSNETGEEDVYKGLHPAVVEELKRLRKSAEDAEKRELSAVAKKYEVIGKKAEELVPLLKSLKAAGGTAYDDMISVLDAAVAAVDASGVFGEIGKSREGNVETTGTIAKAYSQAAEIRKSHPELSEAEALDQVLLADPEMLKAFDK